MKRAMSLMLAAALAGCGGGGADDDALSYTDDSITTGYPMGWLGGRAHPAPGVVKVPDPDRAGATLATGGMVVLEAHAGGPLAAAGVKPGDVIVKVGDAWVPNKEDPGLDLYRLVESEVSAGLEHVRLGVLRGDAVTAIEIANDQAPLEVGGAAGSERLAAVGRAGLDHLAEHGDLEGGVSAASLAGLAFIAGGAESYREQVNRCAERVRAAVSPDGPSMSAWDVAWATLFLAELAGPLAIETPDVVMASGPTNIEGAVPMPAGASGWGVGEPKAVASGELPEGVEIPEGATRTITFSSDDGEMPDLSEMMASGNVQVISMPAGAMPGAAPAGPAQPETEEIDGPLWTPEQLEALAGSDAVARLDSLTLAVDRLVAMQGEDGGWDGPSERRGYSDRTVVTNQVLMSLGAAERAGVAVDNTVIRRGLEYVRANTNDGHVFAVDEPGFDRRREAGRSSGAAAALVSLECVDGDEFHTELIEYSGEHAGTVAGAGSGVPLHVFNTALLRRHQGRAAWATWFEDFRHLVAGLQDPDGSFAELPFADNTAPASPLDADATARTALWSLCALMSSDPLPIVGATAENPLQTAMDSRGGRVAGGAAAATPGDPQLDQEQIMKMLEGMELPDAVREAIEKGELEIQGDRGTP